MTWPCGHPRTAENTSIDRLINYKRCLACKRRSSRDYMARKIRTDGMTKLERLRLAKVIEAELHACRREMMHALLEEHNDSLHESTDAEAQDMAVRPPQDA